MLEGLVAWVLNTYIGEYVENLNTHQLTIGIFQGQVELENLPLKKDALKSLELPIEVKSGFIGKIQLQIPPVRKLKSEQWVINLEKLVLVAGPISSSEYDESKDKKSKLERKKAQLKALEESWLRHKELMAQSATQAKAYSWWSYGTSFITNIVENLQLNVKDIHIRYEDDVSIPGRTFACGITIDHFSAQSADANWLPRFVSSDNGELMNKIVDIQGFSVYWDTAAILVGDRSRAELEELLLKPAVKQPNVDGAENAEVPADSGNTHNYILQPVCAQAKMARNRSALPLRSVDRPRFSVAITLDALPMQLSDTQYHGIVVMMSELERHNCRLQYRRFRPNCAILGQATKWWRYAIDCHLELIRTRRDRSQWSYVLSRARDNVRYVDAYRRSLVVGSRYITRAQKELMDSLEEQLTFDELKVLRVIVLSTEQQTLSTKSSATETTANQDETGSPTSDRTAPTSDGSSGGGRWWLQSWFPGWSGWYGTGSSSPPDEIPQISDEIPAAVPVTESSHQDIEQNLDQEILDVFSESAESSTLLRQDAVFARLSFSLKNGKFSLLQSSAAATTPSSAGTPVTEAGAQEEPSRAKSTSCCLLELECSSINMGFELRPRSGGMKFEVGVQDLYLRDKMTVGLVMPTLIEPLQKDSSGYRPVPFCSMSSMSLCCLTKDSPLSPSGPDDSSAFDNMLFSLVYEKKPLHTKADYRLAISTKPLHITYNPTAIRRAIDFFNVKKAGRLSTGFKSDLAAAARSRYESLKKHTQDELKQTIEAVLANDANRPRAKRWLFDLDICAPHVTVPECLTDPNSIVVVFDLGRLQFRNLSPQRPDAAAMQMQSSDDDDYFVTPMSTPPSESEEIIVLLPETTAGLPETTPVKESRPNNVPSMDISDPAVRQKIYETYLLSLSDLQVMIGRMKDNWKLSYSKGTSLLHVVDKFSISLQFERRLIFTADPRCPKACLTGSLPSLVLHINEKKIAALRTCAHLLSEAANDGASSAPQSSPPPASDSDSSVPLSRLDKSMYYSNAKRSMMSRSLLSLNETDVRSSPLADSVLLMLKFGIDKMSLQIQSRGRSIVELQVEKVRAAYVQKPFEKSVCFSVHSLLVVDALQTLGRDYELLVASHHDLCLDSMSGSILDSKPNSPLSPLSPTEPRSPEPRSPAEFDASCPLLELPSRPQNIGLPTAAVTTALQNLVVPQLTNDSSRGSLLRPIDTELFVVVEDEEALIRVNIDVVDTGMSGANDPTEDSSFYQANIEFNSLDIIANQQTVVELVGFFRQVFPMDSQQAKAFKMTPANDSSSSSNAVTSKAQKELTANFHRLNILLIRVEEKNSLPFARKVATATLSEAKIQATLGSSLVIEGSLCGLQLLDLTPEGRKHQQVLRVGSVPAADSFQRSLTPSTSAALNSSFSRQIFDETQTSADAFTFSLTRGNGVPSASKDRSHKTNDVSKPADSDDLKLVLRLASVSYLHVPLLLRELALCVENFRAYLAQATASLKTAAKELAMGLVMNKPAELLSAMSHYGSTWGLDMGVGGTASRGSKLDLSDRRRFVSVGRLTDDTLFDIDDDKVLEIPEVSPAGKSLKVNFQLDAVFESPVILLPRAAGSSEMLSLHLGKIIICNQAEAKPANTLPFSDTICLEIRDVSVYSLNMEKVRSKSKSNPLDHSSYGTPILHDTSIVLRLQKRICILPPAFANLYADVEETEPSMTGSEVEHLSVTGEVVTPLRIVVTKQIYEQILKTLDNITPPDDVTIESLPSQNAVKLDAESEEIQPSVSALKHDDPSIHLLQPSSVSAASSSVSVSSDEPLVICGSFSLPSFLMQMVADFADNRADYSGLVDLRLESFSVNIVARRWIKSMDIQLLSLQMDDLLQDELSPYRCIMRSRALNADSSRHVPDMSSAFLSHSCPTSVIDLPPPPMPPSLPTSLSHNLENVFKAWTPQPAKQTASAAQRLRKSKSTCDCPLTPPTSPSKSASCSEMKEDPLVHIKVKLVDRKSHQYGPRFNRTNRFIDVNFNRLETAVNLETWVLVLEFLGIGGKMQNPELFTQKAQQQTKMDKKTSAPSTVTDLLVPEEPVVNTDMKLRISSLSLVLNKTAYELARAQVTEVKAHIDMHDGNLAIIGRLGSLSLLDMSPNGSLYRERFVTTGYEALTFDIFKYGTPDPDGMREFDVRVKLTMAAVWYVHTQHFLAELLAFIQNFNQLQDLLGRSRAAAAGKTITARSFHNARISLDINAGAPVILIPHSSRTKDILVLDLGKLRIGNEFLLDGSPGTLSHRRPSRTLSSGLGGIGGFIPATDTQLIPSRNNLDRTHVMNQSVYGSLDDDWRLAPTRLDFGAAESLRDPGVSSASNVLSSFYSTLQSTNLLSASSAISQPRRGSPMLTAFGLNRNRTVSRSSADNAAGTSRSAGSFPVSGASVPTGEDDRCDRCILDVMNIELCDTEVYSARWKARHLDSSWSQTSEVTDTRGHCLVFQSYLVERERGKILKEKCRLQLQVERNLDMDTSRVIPDISIDGKLSSVHLSVDTVQYKLVRGLLEHNFGEQLDDFQNQLMSSLKEPRTQPVLSGKPSTGLSICLELDGVTVDLLISHSDAENPEVSLARLDFQSSQLSFESRTDGSKDIDLVSNRIVVSDSRFKDAPANVRPNVFTDILKPSPDRRDQSALQLELHCRTSRFVRQFTVILNSMRILGVFDWLLATKDFIAMSLEDPFKKEREERELQAAKHGSPPIYVADCGNILTKRNTAAEQREPRFELCLNIIDSELVVVESTADWDTNAVILKSTAILTYRQVAERPLSCNLQSLEVFSCSLAAEAETALSIIDPMSLSIELNKTPSAQEHSFGGPCPTGLLDLTMSGDRPPILEISVPMLSIRLSYNDIRLFTAIINSMPKQLLNAQPITPPKNASCIASHVSKLEALGFNKADCEKALVQCEGELERAAAWLTKNATPVIGQEKTNRLNISGFVVKDGCISICLIDDCQDADVPLAELVFAEFFFLHKFYPQGQGFANFKLVGDYYNRRLSGWEPFIERWGCTVQWNQVVQEFGSKLAVEVKESDSVSVLNINVTNCLIEQWRRTKLKWTDDYYKSNVSGKEYNVMYNSRRRMPFIPFAVRNETGCQLQFAAVKRTLTRTQQTNFQPESFKLATEWKTVDTGQELAFVIDEHDKIRHKHTHELNVHQVILKVDGWQQVLPVSVDKVGVYFRHAIADIDITSKIFNPETPPARIVFEVTIEGSARKVVTVRSALMLNNQLEDTLEVKLRTLVPYVGLKEHRLQIQPSTQVPLPLQFVHSEMSVRPRDWSMEWCPMPLTWQIVNKPGDCHEKECCCTMRGEGSDVYRFCAAVRRLPFPVSSDITSSLPGHVITIAPPVRIENLLPMDVHFLITVPGSSPLTGTVKPGKKSCLVTVDLGQSLELEVTLENFPTCRQLVIPPGTTDFKAKVCLQDSEKRLLELYVSIKSGVGGSLKLSIGAPYWLVNKSGLPLIFKQDGAPVAAGQFEEHEIARSVAPLLFCFADKEKYELCTMKLGKSVHGPGTNPQWCQRFLLERGVAVRQVHVSSNDSRPDWVYNIGIEVRQGRGRYCDTSIVTFTPRYQLDNQSSHKLAYTQLHLVKNHNANEKYLSALPSCVLSYHWPRVDLDTLLCVRLMDKSTCRWSGGFRIDRVDSFHINMREEGNRCLFLRVDIVLNGATYVVVLTDTDQMPPPYRIDNFAEVPVQFYQTKASNEAHLRTYVRPRTSLPYAWDEPTVAPHITLRVQSGTSATYDLNTTGDGEKLYYENFIYIAFTKTFQSSGMNDNVMSQALPNYRNFFESQELVLDVVENNRVVLKKKELGKRSQLWRMSSTGMLQHEGSSAPQDPRKTAQSCSRSSASGSSSVTYVLDIKDIALQPNREVPLTLRKPDDRRKSTQIWKFVNGQLFCGETNLCVQAKDGNFGLFDGSEGVLGPSLPQLSQSRGLSKDIPPEMAIQRQKSQEGSGVLFVKVITDGPTRVLQITDVMQQQYKGTSVDDDWMVIDEKVSRPELAMEATSLNTKTAEKGSKSKQLDLEVSIRLLNGIGISLVDQTPEEIVYIRLRDIAMEYATEHGEQTIRADVRFLQIDNQLFGSCMPVLLYVTPTSPYRDSATDAQPVLTVDVHKMQSRNWNANIFKHFVISLRPLTFQVEEKLLWKLLLFFGFNQSETEQEGLDEAHIGSQRALLSTASNQFRRHYFGKLKINSTAISLSVLTSPNLRPDLKAVKKSLRIPLIRFEDAKVELDAFLKLHLFETTDFLVESIRLHYKKELISQSAKILGSFDFLGNPLGLFSDMAEGVSGLLEGNVESLFKNVTHGVANSAAKLTITLSDNVGRVALDKRHQQQRQQIMSAHSEGSQPHHMAAGLRGLWHGMVGGVVSIPTQAYHGARDEGVTGFMGGIFKGVVGTVVKPITGVLDLAAGTANAIRDTSKGHVHRRPSRVRRPRCCYGHGGLLPTYADENAEAQEMLLRQNNYNYDEKFIAIEVLRTGEDELRVLISSQTVYFIGRNYDVVLRVKFDELFECMSVSRESADRVRKYYIELTVAAESPIGATADVPKKRPEVRCDSESTAQKVVQHINYAKNLHDEMKQTVPVDVTTADD